MTTIKTGDLTQAQIIAQSAEINKVQWNKNLNWHAKKAILTACDYVPTVSGDWTTAPTTVALALDELGARPLSSEAEVFENKKIESNSSLVDATDNTKTLKWNLAAQNTGVDITLTTGVETADRVINIPILGGDKTLDFIDLAQTVSAIKTFSAANVHFATMTIVDAATNPKAIGFSTTGATASTKITLTAAQTSNIAVNLPTAAGTIALTSDIGADVRAVANVTLLAAAVQDLHNTPVELIAAPAAGTYIAIEMIELLTTGTVGYDGVAGGEDFTIQYSTAGVNIATVETTGWIDQAAAAGRVVAPTHLATAIARPATATNVTIKNSGAVFAAAGDHGLKVRCYYRVLTVLT